MTGQRLQQHIQLLGPTCTAGSSAAGLKQRRKASAGFSPLRITAPNLASTTAIMVCSSLPIPDLLAARAAATASLRAAAATAGSWEASLAHRGFTTHLQAAAGETTSWVALVVSRLIAGRSVVLQACGGEIMQVTVGPRGQGAQVSPA